MLENDVIEVILEEDTGWDANGMRIAAGAIKLNDAAGASVLHGDRIVGSVVAAYRTGDSQIALYLELDSHIKDYELYKTPCLSLDCLDVKHADSEGDPNRDNYGFTVRKARMRGLRFDKP